MVLDEVWRGLDGVEALSGPEGGPLRRTVKLILDPLVIRPVQYPSCAGAILTADGATLLAARIHAHADTLRATDAWFRLLKQVRRRLRITEGNAQDLYFQRCFELAVTHGHPDPQRDRLRAESMLREIHGFAAGRTTQALKDHLTDPTRVAELDRLLDIAWGRRPAPPAVPAEHRDELRRLLESAVATRTESAADTGPGRLMLRQLIAAHAGIHTGIELWRADDDGRAPAGSASAVRGNGLPAHIFEPAAAPGQRAGVRESGVRESGRAATAHRVVAAYPSRYGANLLGLTELRAPARPALGSSASTAGLGLPLDRSIYERVFTVLQVSTERADLPPIPDLVATEITRSCAPWALLDESLRVTAAAGVELALGLAPISAAGGREAAAGTAESAAQRLINSRWQREAYVLQARRLAIHPVPGELGPLATIAAELRTPWRPYLRRLWVRLHGRDVREQPVAEPGELWDLLDGIARSVVLDHRTRVRKALSAQAAGPDPEMTESRAV
ncbi:hypothetical protein [Nocardia sp. NPDC051750]|uniref:hypothetical protein n=1 Tax=Nocardia sp. NPDC051750 TaxID=3364325 RepID=UPI0037943E28